MTEGIEEVEQSCKIIDLKFKFHELAWHQHPDNYLTN